MTRFRGHVRSEEPIVQSDRSTHASFIESADRRHVFVSLVAGQATETLIAQEWTIRAGQNPLMSAAGAQRIDQDEGRRL